MCRNLCAICGQVPTEVHTDVVLEHQGIGKLALAQGARVLNTCIVWPCMMGGQVGPQTAFGRERPSTYLTWKRALPQVCSLVKPQCSGTAQHPQTYPTLVVCEVCSWTCNA